MTMVPLTAVSPGVIHPLSEFLMANALKVVVCHAIKLHLEGGAAVLLDGVKGCDAAQVLELGLVKGSEYVGSTRGVGTIIVAPGADLQTQADPHLYR